MIKILFLAANPKDTDQLRLGEEVREIKERLRLADLRDQFVFEQEWSVRVTDLQGHLLHHQPHIVHFSGHGSSSGKIILEDHSGHSTPVSSEALKRLFATLTDNVRCVVLNACYTEAQAHGIVESIDCVVGMSSAIPDKSAIAFASSFYQALGYGRSIQTAFDSGCVEIALRGTDRAAAVGSSDSPGRDVVAPHKTSQHDDTPKLKVKTGIDATTIFLARPLPWHSTDVLRNLWAGIPQGDRAFLAIMAAIAFICTMFGFVTPLMPLSMLAKTMGFIIIINSLFYTCFLLSTRFLNYGPILVKTGWEVAVPSVLLGAILYSLCLLTPANAKCLRSDNPTIILERFGRFVFLGAPFGVAVPLVICSIINLADEAPAEPKQSETERENVRGPAARLTITVATILIAITTLIAGNIKRLGLALPGPDLGDIDPVGHLGLTVVAFLVALLVRFQVEAKWPWASRYVRRLLRFLPAVITLTYLTTILLIYRWPGEFVAPGTGLGVVTSIMFGLANLAFLSSYLVARLLPAMVANTRPKPGDPAGG